MDSIKILGSAAAEGIPARFCDCELCRKAWQIGGKEFRMTTAYAFNERVRIDYGPDSFAQDLKFKLNSAKMKHLFFTHAHEDHLDTFAFRMRRQGFSNSYEPELNIYGRPTVWNSFIDMLGMSSPVFKSLKYNKLELFQPVEIPEEDMTFYPVPATHYHIDGEAVFFAIRHRESWLLIANDTGIPQPEVMDFMEKNNMRFDVVIADCCGQTRDYKGSHLGGIYLLNFRDDLKTRSCIDDKTKFVVNHFSHNGLATHEDMEKYFNPRGIAVGYDGMTITYGPGETR